MKHALADMLDVPKLQRILDRFARISSVSPAVTDADGNVVLAAGWAEVCSRFHRACPAVEARCKASNADLVAEACRRRAVTGSCCANGLWDYAWPVFIGDEYLGSLWVGQFFQEPPDEARFRAQARELGFDEEAYLAATRQVPVVSQERIAAIVDFFEELAGMISGAAAERGRFADAVSKLESSEQRYAALADALPDAVYITDRDGNAIYVNRAAARMVGRAPEDIVGKPHHEIFPRSADRHRAAIEHVFDSGQPLARTPVKETTSSGDLWIDVHLVPLRHHDGHVTAVMGISRVITDQVRAEQDLRHSEQTYRTLVENSEDHIVRLDGQQRIVHVNRAALAFNGVAAHDVVGRSIADAAGPRGPLGALKEPFEIAFAKGQPVHAQVDLARPGEAETRRFDLNVIPEFDDAGRVATVMAVARDITALAHAQEAMVRSQQLAAVGTLAGGIAHEFNNIHTIALGQLEYVLKMNRLGDADREVIETTRTAVMRAVKVTRNILAFARGGRAERRVISLATVASDTVQFVRRSFEAEGVQIVVHQDQAPNVLVDPGQISQVLMNLIINAHHATIGLDVKRVEVETGAADGRVFIRVTDTGCGISREDIERVTLPFFSTKGEHARPGSALAKVRGMGLGLSVSDTLIKLNDGVLAIDSEVGRGTAVTVSFPPDEGSPLHESAAPPEAADERPLRVLVIDDEPLILALFERFLEDAGHSVTITDDGEEALRCIVASEPRFDAVIVDVQMPKMNGIEFVGRLKAAKVAPRPAVLLCTGQVGEDPAEFDALGVAGVLRKPLNMSSIAAAVQAAVRAAG